MLSIKNLVKVYKTKGGTEVRALDDVSVDFPERGMVFLLGKSGSGKSTLLNVAGGLDRPDMGEVIVKGKSSKDFSASDFDSYRNTYIGFIFQEYNILDEFNVEQNISLALQLQGKKNDKAAVNALLEQVDLTGLGKRKPNTLSGGQKQRVAIARALIKEPEIIMADEPTGALDSATGKQVFDTLKKLSADKLVIVVSHDREFAEQYGDRVIELKDGKILSDTSKALAAPTDLSANVNAIGSDTVRVKDWNKLTQEDFNQIWAMMKGSRGEVIISASEEDMPAIKRVCKIAEDGSKEYFKETDRSAVKVGQYDASRTKFIKSRMPMGRAVKMGASSLKTKPVRLFFTILLSVISFAMFGVLSTMMMYDPIYSIASALEGSAYSSALLTKNYNYTYRSYQEDRDGNRTYEDREFEASAYTIFGESEVDELNKNAEGLKFAGVFGDYNYSPSSYSDSLGARSNAGYYYSARNYTFWGFTDCGERYMTDNGFTRLAGEYPEGKNDIAVSKYVYEAFEQFGYRYNNTTALIESASDLIGKKIAMNVGNKWDSNAIEFTITGVYDTGSLEKYNDLKSNESQLSPDALEDLKDTFYDMLASSFHSLCYVSDAFCDEYGKNFRNSDQIQNISTYGIQGVRLSDDKIDQSVETYEDSWYYPVRAIQNNADSFTLYGADGSTVSASSLTVGANKAYAPLGTIFNKARELYTSGNEWYDIYADSDGNRHEILRGAYTQQTGFYVNYAGDVSFEEKPGYGFLPYGYGYISKNGEVSDYLSYMWQSEYGTYYENGLGKVTTDRPANYVTVQNGYYVNDATGDMVSDWKENYKFVEGNCYFSPNESKIYLTAKLPDDYYIEKVGSYYVMNSGEIRLDDPTADWRYISGYYVDYNGNFVSSESMEGYKESNLYIYFNDDGDYSLTPQKGYDYQSSWYYIDDDGNVSRDWMENGTQKCGLYVNNRGEVSLTKKDGYVFTDHYFSNTDTGDVKFVTHYYGFWTDAEGNGVLSPYNGKVHQGNAIMKKYGDYTENADYAAAFKRMAKACLGPYQLSDFENQYGKIGDTGEFTSADMRLIITSMQNDFQAWCGTEFTSPSVYAKNADGEERTLEIVGYYTLSSANGDNNAYILSDEFVSDFEVVYDDNGNVTIWGQENKTNYVEPSDAKYNYVITLTNNTQEQTHFMLEERDGDVYYSMNNKIYNEATSMAYQVDMLELVFVIAGAVMAVLSALMLFNFISASISAKRKEIGVLRAVGARGTDVFKIFFSEAFIIAMICFVLSAVAAGVACFIMNGIFMTSVAISLLNYGILQIALILGISLVIAFIATILPVCLAAKKPPVESIRAL